MGFVPNSLKMLFRKPKMLQIFVEFALEASKDDATCIQLKYLAGLIASIVSGCTYCQAHLSVTVAKDDASDKKIASLWQFESSDLYDDAECVALRFARDVAQQPRQVKALHFKNINSYSSEERTVELLAIACLFRWLNCWNDTIANGSESIPFATAGTVLGDGG